MTSLHEPVMELVRASLDPAAGKAAVRQDHPACQVVIRVVETDMEAGGLDNVNTLAVGAGVAAAGLTSWLAQERNRDPEQVLRELSKAAPAGGKLLTNVVDMLTTLLSGPPGMQQTAEFMVALFHEDEEAFYDLIVDLGAYVAVCIGMLESYGISSKEKTLRDLDDMLEAFHAG
ncbi:hypothetical protein EV284_2790 [Streptomyces sp. BK022]|nr:hypothetical protein EV284_2790 [Streptomyces sp. BK022]